VHQDHHGDATRVFGALPGAREEIVVFLNFPMSPFRIPHLDPFSLRWRVRQRDLEHSVGVLRRCMEVATWANGLRAEKRTGRAIRFTYQIDVVRDPELGCKQAEAIRELLRWVSTKRAGPRPPTGSRRDGDHGG
jgi:hypothetical protein